MPEVASSWVLLSCFGLMIVSALVPWVNAEVMLVSFVGAASSRTSVVAFVLVASLGQMFGKCVLYWTSQRALPHFKSERVARSFNRVKDRLSAKPFQTFGLILFSSIVGFPPFYLVTMAAGALQVRFSMFCAFGSIGRLVRFGTIAILTRLAI